MAKLIGLGYGKGKSQICEFDDDSPSHPTAEAFPMFPDDELEELIFDIKANGLQQPLVVDQTNGEVVLIDGRNRWEACKRAGVVPDYVLLDG